MTHQQVMTPQWIDCGSSAIFIGPFWMGSAEQKARTQEAIENQWTFSTKTPIDEEIALYEDTSTSEEAATHDDPTSTEFGETHYDEEILQDEEVACQAPILDTQVYR